MNKFLCVFRKMTDLHAFYAQKKYTSFYPYYLPNYYQDYYPRKFRDRYYEPRTRLEGITVSETRSKSGVGVPSWFIVLALVGAFAMFKK